MNEKKHLQTEQFFLPAELRKMARAFFDRLKNSLQKKEEKEPTLEQQAKEMFMLLSQANQKNEVHMKPYGKDDALNWHAMMRQNGLIIRFGIEHGSEENQAGKISYRHLAILKDTQGVLHFFIPNAWGSKTREFGDGFSFIIYSPESFSVQEVAPIKDSIQVKEFGRRYTESVHSFLDFSKVFDTDRFEVLQFGNTSKVTPKQPVPMWEREVVPQGF